jgi:WD40 repeat protein
MLRVLLTVALAAGIAVGVAWYFDLWPSEAGSLPGARSQGTEEVNLGTWLYQPAPPTPEPPVPPRRPGPPPIVVSDGHFVIYQKADIPSQKDGPLLFIGGEINQQDPSRPVLAGTAEMTVGDQKILKTYRPLDRNDVVAPGEMVAMVDPSLALAELDAARMKKVAAEADLEASKATYREAQFRLDRLDKLRAQRLVGLVTEEEYSAAVLYRDRYKQEEVSKGEAVRLSRVEIDKALTILHQHEIRNRTGFTGIIKTLYKQRNEAVKAQEPVLLLYDIEHLRAEGLAEVQYFDRLKVGTRVTLEPTILEPPWFPYKGHSGEINSVAFGGRGDNLRIVSGSEDHTAHVWSVALPKTPSRVLYHEQPVRVVACTPPGSGYNWCLTGCADGSIRLWDLDKGDAPPLRVIKDRGHRTAVTALAFSPDGKYFASGGEDSMIYLWRTDDRSEEPVYAFDGEHGVDQPHQGTITALHFTPQARLISAARDGTLRIWELHQHGAHMDKRVISNRSGTVSALGVSADGSRMLFDHGRELQVRSVPDGRTLATMQTSSAATPFETLALYSPDAALILTAGAPEGRLQLWRAPTPAARAFEVRQFVTEERAPVTCAAFAPEGGYAVSGTKDGNVYLWRMPTPLDVAASCITDLQLTQVDSALDANSRQVRISVNVHNPIDAQHPRGRFVPGRPVTIVIEP